MAELFSSSSLQLIEGLRARIDTRLAALLPAAGTPLADSMRHAALGPGQRLRPLLAMLAAHELGSRDDDAAALDAACAIELVHAASLALDDLPAMDGALLRRGQRATHVVHGQDMAILAAVSLLGRAFEIVATLPGVDAARRAGLSAQLAAAVGQLAAGQTQDLRGATDAAALAACSRDKTGVLFELAVRFAAGVAGCDSDDARAADLERCAAQLGCAYQIHDDLLDAPADGDRSNHAVHLGADGARHRLRQRVDAALAALPRRDGPLGRFVGALFA